MIVAGIMSGTSADGVSVAILKFSDEKFRLVRFKTFPIAPALRKKIHALANASARETAHANFEIGKLFGACMRSFPRVDLIGSHGQTIYHCGERKHPATLQIGEPAVIAEMTGVTVVADFRPAHIAAGGQGAPLIPLFDRVFFSNRAGVALQNIGGIANVTAIGRNETVAFDTGPGNCIIDHFASRLGRDCDRDGTLSAHGAVDLSLLRRLRRNPFLKLAPPKSADRLQFVKQVERLSARGCDGVATAVYHVAESISDAHRRFVRLPVGEVVVSGGGALNPTLMRHLSWMLFPARVRSIAELGWHPLAKEPACFAFLALRAVRGNSPLGKIVPGKNFGKLMEKTWRSTV